MRKMMTLFTTALLVMGVSGVRADDRDGKQAKGPVSFRLATSTPTPDFEKMATEDGQTVYVSPRVSFTNDEVVTALQGTGRNGLDLTITADAAERINRTPTDRVAVFVNGRLAAAPRLDEANADGRVVMSDLSARQLQQLSGVLGVTSNGATGAVMPVICVGLASGFLRNTNHATAPSATTTINAMNEPRKARPMTRSSA